VVSLPPGGVSGGVAFRRWNQREFAALLHFFVHHLSGQTLDELYEEPDRVMTFLRDGRRYVNYPIDGDLVVASLQEGM